MSLSREATNEICDYVREHTATLFGQKFRECRLIMAVQVQMKNDKLETKFLAISKFRVFFLSGKQFSVLRVEKCFNVLALRKLHVVTPEYALNINWEERGRISNCLIKTVDEKEATDLACEFLSSIKHYFPDIKKSLTKFLQLNPLNLLNLFSLLPTSTPDLPCNNFRRSYVTYCDFIDQLYREDIVWEIEHVYFVHDIHEIRLDDFSHLPIKDQIAIIGCIQFSSYFTGIFVNSFKLSVEHIDAISNIVRHSHALKSLTLINCGLSKDFPIQLAAALQHNQTLPLENLNLSGNNIDDKKGITQLSVVLPRVRTLKSLILIDCGLSEKSIHHIAVGLYTGFGVDASHASVKFEFRSLSLSKNVLKDDANELINFISLCNTLRELDLSHTGFIVDKLWSALKLGGLQLESLCLAGCQIGKKCKENNLQLTVKELFSSMVNLKKIDLSGTTINVDLLQNILLGISNNNRICDIILILDGSLEGRGCATAIEQYIVGCPVANLSLRDNFLEHDLIKILPALAKMRSLKCIDLGGTNFQSLKNNKKYSSTLSRVLTELGDLILNEESRLEEVILSDCRLGCACLSVVLDSLGASTKIKAFDISNNEIGNVGARLISKALQLNNTLKRLNLDRNQIGIEGFNEIAHGLKLNYCLNSMPYPINDVAAIPDRAKVLPIIAVIEKYLERNKTNLNLSAQCCQTTLHALISHCDKYNINESDEKKIIFHNLIKTIVELGSFPVLNVSFDNVVNEILSIVKKLSTENAELFAQKFIDLLSIKSVEIYADTETKKTAETNQSLDIDLLRIKLNSLIKDHLTHTSWNSVQNRADSLLSSPNTLKIRGLLNCNIDHSVHAAISEQFLHGIIRRPNSMFHESLFASLTSADNSINGNLLEEVSGNHEKFTPLSHLAKNRPMAARHTKKRINSSPKDSYGSIATDDSFDYINDPKSLQQKSRQSSGAENECNNHQIFFSESNEELRNSPCGNSSSTTPPPLIPRRSKGSGGAPPKLPPKPSMDFSPTPNSFRNGKTIAE